MPQREDLSSVEAYLPEDLHQSLHEMLRLLSKVSESPYALEEIRNQIKSDIGLKGTAIALAGKSIEQNKSLISFGNENMIGDIQIGSVVGGDLITINVSPTTSQSNLLAQLQTTLSEIKEYTISSVNQNQQILAKLFRLAPNIELVRDAMSDLYHVQENRLGFIEWETILTVAENRIPHAEAKIHIPNIILLLRQLRRLYYSRSNKLYDTFVTLEDAHKRVKSEQVAQTFSRNIQKDRMVDALHDERVTLEELQRLAKQYIDNLQGIQESLGRAIGSIKAIS